MGVGVCRVRMCGTGCLVACLRGLCTLLCACAACTNLCGLTCSWIQQQCQFAIHGAGRGECVWEAELQQWAQQVAAVSRCPAPTCMSAVSSRGGSRPRRPKRSRSDLGKAVPCVAWPLIGHMALADGCVGMVQQQAGSNAGAVECRVLAT